MESDLPEWLRKNCQPLSLLCQCCQFCTNQTIRPVFCCCPLWSGQFGAQHTALALVVYTYKLHQINNCWIVILVTRQWLSKKIRCEDYNHRKFSLLTADHHLNDKRHYLVLTKSKTYLASSQFSAKTHNTACLLSKALAASCIPCTTPSWIRAVFRTSCRAWWTSMGPPLTATGTEGVSSLKTSSSQHLLTAKIPLVSPRPPLTRRPWGP